MRSAAFAGLAALVCAATAVPAAAEAMVDAATLERDVRILADDDMEGRETGTPGYDRASGYLAGRFASLGLEPGGEGGTFFQPVPLRTYSRDPERSAITLIDAEGQEFPLTQWEDFYVTGNARNASGTLEAPLVFIGYGLDMPGRDDFAAVDLAGKIAVRVYGGPAKMDAAESAHYRSTLRDRLSEEGAVGMVLVWSPKLGEVYEWDSLVESAQHDGTMTWIGPDGIPGDTAPNIQVSAVMSPAVSREILARTPLGYSRLSAIESTDTARFTSFDTGLSMRIEYASTFEDIVSNNVVAMLPGTDPALADEYVVMTAHLDHVGIQPTEAEGDDEIYNGAMDNATGIASLLEVARLLKQDPPRRPTLFIGLTAEEKGLVGSSYNAAHPTVPRDQLAAVLNLDMPIVTWDFTDIVAFGADHSTIMPAVAAAAREHGVSVIPDPQPEQGFFTRSDQYSYVQQGIPAVSVDPGFGNGGDARQREFLSSHYHQPSDEADLVDYAALARFVALNYSIARNLADAGERQVWNRGDFFGRTFGGRMAD